MGSALLNSLAQDFAMAAGTCFIVLALALRFMRAKVNACLPAENKISWPMELALRKRIIADYRRLYPRGWGYPILRISFIVWTVLVMLAILAKILGTAI